MKKKPAILIGVAVFILTITLVVSAFRSREAAAKPAVVQAAAPTLIAGPGRVEPVSEDIRIGSELSGKLKAVNVEEGNHVRRGQVLAVLENADYSAAVISAEADVHAKEANLEKVVNGARSQERFQALASVREAKAVMDNAKAEMERRQKLFEEAGVISKEELDRHVRAYHVAREQYQAALQRHSLIDDNARKEDVALAQADLQFAQGRLQEARAKYDKTLIKSPIDGVVLRKHHRAGESVSNSSTVPDPIITVGDTTVLRVRMDVDETDVNRVQLGQKAYVVADAFGDQKFWGHVVRIGNQLGPKNVRTDEPTEKVDKKILETLIELDNAPQLPDGLRVDAYVVPSENTMAQAR